MLGLALLFALLLDTPRVGWPRFSRIAIFLPYAVPGVIASACCGASSTCPAVSPINAAAEAVGLPAAGPASATRRSSSRWPTSRSGAASASTCWCSTPRCGPSPRSCTRRPGSTAASELQIALRIKIPLLRPALILTTVFSLIAHAAGVQRADHAAAADQHDHARPGCPLMKVYRDAFVDDDIYSAAATSVVIAAVTLVLSFGFLRWSSARLRGGLMSATARAIPATTAGAARRRLAAHAASCCSARSTACCRCCWVVIAATKSAGGAVHHASPLARCNGGFVEQPRAT